MCNEQTCGNCRHFRRHYVRYARGRYMALSYGHCVKPRLKNRVLREHAMLCNSCDRDSLAARRGGVPYAADAVPRADASCRWTACDEAVLRETDVSARGSPRWRRR